MNFSRLRSVACTWKTSPPREARLNQLRPIAASDRLARGGAWADSGVHKIAASPVDWNTIREEFAVNAFAEVNEEQK